MAFALGPRRGIYIDLGEEKAEDLQTLNAEEFEHFETFDLIYRSLCALLYNYVPLSGHPGGSISSGRIVASLLFNMMDYDFSDPERADADIISYAAGHKALGLYGMWALRNEVARIGAPELLPKAEKLQLRLEDLLGFRRNPVTATPLFKKFNTKPLDGHPTPATPFVRLSTGASGVGVATSLGLAFGARDYYGTKAPKVHIIEGEGGMTPGRVAEALAAAGTASLDNAILHLDWNQASIDSNHVTREGSTPGDYVQWTPQELAYVNDWNVIYVPDGKDIQQVVAAQRRALAIDNGQPTAIVYRTIKGWKYGIEGKASHGAGHKMCTSGFYDAVAPLLEMTGATLPSCEAKETRCDSGARREVVEECFWEALDVVRKTLEHKRPTVEMLAGRLTDARRRLNAAGRSASENAPAVDKLYETIESQGLRTPEKLELPVGGQSTLRAALGKTLNYLNQASNGAVLAAAADLLGSTSVSTSADGFPEGFYNAKTNPGARLLSIGGICEDAIAGILAGLSAYGRHIGAGSSYGAFVAPLGHISARLHAIGNMAKQEIRKSPYDPFILICAHAGLKTGEDGPTHADPQPLQLLQENFPLGTAITLTPWDPAEIWPLFAAAMKKRPAVIAPFVTRPNEKIFDRKALRLAPLESVRTGLYALRSADGAGDGTIVLQGSGVTNAFVADALPLLDKEGLNLNIYYVASAELFALLPKSEQEAIFPQERAQEAMAITGFTIPTMYRWITSDYGRAMSLYPFKKGHYLGSGQADMVLAEAGLDGKSQFKSIKRYVSELKR